MANVIIPASWRRHSGGMREVTATGSTVRQVIESLDSQFPGFQDRLIVNDRLRPGLAVAVDARISDVGLLEQVGPNSEVVFLPSISGG